MLHYQTLEWHNLNENLCKCICLKCRCQCFRGTWPGICELEGYESLIRLTGYENCMIRYQQELFLFSLLFFMALSFLVSNGYVILFYSYTLTLTHLYKSHLLTHRKVTLKRLTYSRGLFATYRVLTCVTVGACTAGWALHTAHCIHLNTHIGTVAYT